MEPCGVLDNPVTKQRPILHQTTHTDVPPECYSLPHDLPDAERFGEKIMCLLGNPQRARIQNRSAALPIALSAMDGNFSAATVRRKWPCRGGGRIEVPMVTVAAVLLTLWAPSGPAAARHSRPDPWSDLFRVGWQKPRRAALRTPAPVLVPLPKPRPADAPAAAPDAAADGNRMPAPSDKPAEPVAAAPQPSACRRALTEAIAIAPSIPDIHGEGGCGGVDLVRLEAVVLPDKRQVSVKPAAILRCPMASAIADWVRTDIAPLAAGTGSGISSLDNFDSFECRSRNRVAGAPLSEHGRANALDVRALKLANGQSISLTDRTAPRELRESVLHSVCARFSTVLGPGSDGYHEDHIHLDLMERHSNYKICQWNVWDSLPKIAPLLPAARPDEAPPREAAAKSDAAK
jgi:hypothetical protein